MQKHCPSTSDRPRGVFGSKSYPNRPRGVFGSKSLRSLARRSVIRARSAELAVKLEAAK